MKRRAQREVDVVALLASMRKKAQRSGAPQVAALATSERFDDARARQRIPQVVTEHREKLGVMRTALEAELGKARKVEGKGEELEALTWATDDSRIRLVLDHADAELPVTITLTVEALAVRSTDDVAPATCGCAELLAFDRYDELFEAIRALRGIFVRLEPTLERIGVTDASDGSKLRLYRCRACRALFQSTGDRPEIVFPVDETPVEDWRASPFASPIALSTYEHQVRWYLETADRAVTAERCRREGCEAFAVKHSVFCFDHHVDGRPEPPQGRVSTLCRRRG